MTAGASSHERSISPGGGGFAFAQAAGSVFSLIRRYAAGVEHFTQMLEACFRPALTITHPRGGFWFATLDTISPEKNHVDAVVRLSRSHPVELRAAARGIPENEERDRPLFNTPVPSATSAADDLVVSYTFPMFLSEHRNVEPFGEFAGNELARLREP